MADSKEAIAKTLVHEGGYVNNPNDVGGATKYGVTQADMPGINMETITQDQATAYYNIHYWKMHYSEIEQQTIADKLFDMGVLFGVGTAVKILQHVLKIVEDGAFGPVSLLAVNAAEPASLLTAYKMGLVAHAAGIVQTKFQDREFFAGWVNRINS